jgi:hypothetical protein
MCWSFGASFIFAIIGFIASGYLIYKKESKLLWIPIGYFAIMELLQAITYFSLNQCSLPINQLLTYISYLHVAFQPFFMNAFWLPKETRKRISPFVYGICFIGTILILIQAYPFEWAGTCDLASGGWCGPNICSISGDWHLAWNIPLNGIPMLLIIGYAFPIFILPLLYGSWKVTIYQTLLGPVLVSFLSSNPNETPAIWCLLSMAIILLAIVTGLRNIMHVKKWYFWKYPFEKK